MDRANRFTGMKQILKKNSKIKNKFFKYKNYNVEFYEKPFLNENIEVRKKIVSSLDQINLKFNYSHGVFNKNKRDYILENSFLMIVTENSICVGTFLVFHFVLDGKNVCYQGIYCSSKKENLFMHILGLKLNEFIYKSISNFKMVSLTNIPYVSYLLIDSFSNVFPAPDNMKKTSKENLNIFDKTEKIIRDLFLDEKEKMTADKKRFVLKIENNSVANKKINQLPRSKNFKYNCFMNFLIDDSQTETVFFIGEYNLLNKIKNLAKLVIFKILY